MPIAVLVSLGTIGIVAGGFGWLIAGQALDPLHSATVTPAREAPC